MLTIPIQNAELEKRFLIALQEFYSGNADRLIADLLQFLEDLEDQRDIELRKNEPLLAEEQIRLQLQADGWTGRQQKNARAQVTLSAAGRRISHCLSLTKENIDH